MSKDYVMQLEATIENLRRDNALLKELNAKYKDLEEKLGCPSEEIVEFVNLLKKYYYVDITGRLQARTVWDNIKLKEEELYRINHIFNDIKDKGE